MTAWISSSVAADFITIIICRSPDLELYERDTAAAAGWIAWDRRSARRALRDGGARDAAAGRAPS